MTRESQPRLSTRLTDILFALLALVSMGLFFLWMPSEHPDGLLQRVIVEQEAIERSRSFLLRQQADTTGLEPNAELKQNSEMLGALQRRLGRSTAISYLRDGGIEELPTYYWEVSWTPNESPEEDEQRITTQLTATGNIFSYTSRGVPTRPLSPDVDALTAVALSFGSDNATPVDLPDEQPDSPGRPDRRLPQSQDSLFAAIDSVLTALDEATGRTVRILRMGRTGGRRLPVLDTLAAFSLARYHLEKSSEVGSGLVADSIWMPQERRGAVVVRFVSVPDVQGVEVEAIVETTTLGVLTGLNTKFGGPGIEVPAYWRRSTLIDTISIVSLVLLVIILIVAFFRKMGAKSVDARVALRDGVAMGLLGFVSVALGLGGNVMTNDSPAQGRMLFFGILIASVFAAVGIGLLIFFIAGATDSISREVEKKRTRTLDFLRSTHFTVQAVGASILRGVALGMILVGIFVIILKLFPEAWIAGRPDAQLGPIWLSAFVATLAASAWSSYMTLAIAFLGVLSFLRTKKLSRGVLIALAILTIGMLDASFARFGSSHSMAVSTMFSGAFLLFVFWRFDFLTAMVSMTVGSSIWKSGLTFWNASGLSHEGWIACVLLGGLALVAGYIALRGKPTDQAPVYVPGYITEMAARERMTRELEIARQVQVSFLPDALPDMKGVQVAGMCLAAYEVGGDYYDFVRLSESRIAVIIGDVSGKGIQAAFYMTLSKAFFRSLCREIATPTGVLQRMNRLFWENSDRGTFISVIYGVLDLADRSFVFARAGHNPVILKRSPSQDPEIMRPAGIALGLDSGDKFDTSIEEVKLSLRPGDALVLYTDGFSEAMNDRKDMYGDRRLVEKVGEVGALSAEDMLVALTNDVESFVGGAGQHDDMTMVVVKLTGDGTGFEAEEPGSHA